VGVNLREPNPFEPGASVPNRPNLQRRLIAILGLCAMAALAACSGGAGASPSGAAPAGASVTVGGMSFSPRSVTVKVGATVTWTWSGRMHDVRFSDGPASPVQSQGTWARTFAKTGTYTYHCDLHPMMTGTVVVT
jgi:plastocyanin